MTSPSRSVDLPEAMIRYFCVVAPGPAGDLPYAYLEALAGVGRTIRAQPIGMADFTCDGRWWRAGTLFMTPMQPPFVNVVCARPGLVLGTRLDLKTMARSIHGTPAIATPRDEEPVVYEPETALVGYYTVGCINVAITWASPLPSNHEVMALAKYDAVICPTAEDAETMRRLLGMHHHRHARVLHVEPDRVLLRDLIDTLCGSSTSATTSPSPASGAPRATTPPPLPPTPPGPRSRSSTGSPSPATPTPARPPSAPSPGTAISIASSAPGRVRAILRRIWSWLTGSRNS